MTTTHQHAELRELLDLTIQAAAVKRRVDVLRARIDAAARTEYEESDGATPSWKIKGLGAVRLDGTDNEPTPYVADQEALASYVAEHHPTEAFGVLVVPTTDLATAIEALGFAGVAHASKIELRATATKVALAKATLVDLDEDDDDKPEPRWACFNPEGVEIPGIGGAPGAQPRLVVTPEPAAKQAALDLVDAELAATAPTPETETEAVA